VGINVTPMVDVVLVLLVIMMVSATYIVSQSLKVELPKTASSDEPAPKVLTVTLTRDGQTLLDGQAIAAEELARELAARRGPAASLVLQADQAVPHGQVVHVIDVAKVNGITKFSLSVDRSR
jgi:biopolymer transport protein ExbD